MSGNATYLGKEEYEFEFIRLNFMKEPIFKATHIVKQFGPTIALNDVDIEIYPGEIRGFIGENGSGKSTMSAIMTGIYQKTSGTMEYHGKPWEPTSMVEALEGGIGIIVQENGTISAISVAENIFLGELKQFSGVNYFEEKKIENFSPLFNLDMKDFDTKSKEYLDKISSATKEETKPILKEASAVLKEMHKNLKDELMRTNETKKQEIIARFDEESKKEFDKLQNEFELITDDVVRNNMKYISNSCNVTLEYTPDLLPIYDKDINPNEFLRNLAYKGIKRRLNDDVIDKYIERLDYELSVIEKMGFSDYFLVVWDYVKYAKFNNILVGPGRGSAAGSLVSYAIGITDVDPIKYDLLFERFLNPERVTMPDIDVDFDSEKRNLVTEYVTKKYGEKHAIGIITFNTLGAKQVIRDLARCMDISLPIYY